MEDKEIKYHKISLGLKFKFLWRPLKPKASINIPVTDPLTFAEIAMQCSSVSILKNLDVFRAYFQNEQWLIYVILLIYEPFHLIWSHVMRPKAI